MRGDTMLADTLSRQPMAENYPGVKEARQAKEETRQAKATSSADFGLLPTHNIRSAMEIRTINRYPLQRDETIRRKQSTIILTIMDAFTRYTELVAIPDKKTTTVAKELLDQWILRHGFYEQVISDHGGEFVSDVMDKLNKLLRLRHHVISPYSPHINGQVERIHQTMGDYLKTYCNNAPAEWTDFLPSLRFALNTHEYTAAPRCHHTS